MKRETGRIRKIPAIPEELKNLILAGENEQVEFKKSQTQLTKDVYETVCAFSNRNGGHIFLGVRDNGEIVGIDQGVANKMKKEFVDCVNNGNKIHPPLYLNPIEFEDDGRIILYVHVPVSQEVCRCNGRIFDRNHEADLDITNHSDEVYRLYSKKSSNHFVNRIFPAFRIEDLDPRLIERAKRMTFWHVKRHPWQDMSNEELIRSANLYLRDPHTGEEGITLAAILLFGTDQLIMSVLPQHKTDAIFRVYNTDRYDDRDVVITNLIDSFDRLMAFGEKHLNDTFHLEGRLAVRVSARNQILREIISNLLAHRDYASAYPAKMVIEHDRIYTENANLSHGSGILNLDTFEPFPKNPPISKVFREIGLADELGSGMRNTYKYTEMYSGGEPRFEEGNIFRITIPLSEVATAKVGPGSSIYIKEASERFGANKQRLSKKSGNDAMKETRNDAIHEATNEVVNEAKGLADENGQNKLIKTHPLELKIIKAIQKNPFITRKELAKRLQTSESTIYRALENMKTRGVLERAGSNKSGYWSILR